MPLLKIFLKFLSELCPTLSLLIHVSGLQSFNGVSSEKISDNLRVQSLLFDPGEQSSNPAKEKTVSPSSTVPDRLKLDGSYVTFTAPDILASMAGSQILRPIPRLEDSWWYLTQVFRLDAKRTYPSGSMNHALFFSSEETLQQGRIPIFLYSIKV